MKTRSPDHSFGILAALGLIALFADPATAQYGRWDRTGQPIPWENDRVRVSQIAIEPGSNMPAGTGAGRVLVYLTAGPDGAMAPEAVWQTGAEGDLPNRGRVRLEALAIDLKEAPSAPSDGTPPETLPTTDDMEVSTLVDNPRVLVTRHRYAPNTSYGAEHFHGQDVLVVYLRGGYTWPIWGTWGASPVRRGEVDVIPANTFHALGNAGSDPLEFLLIVPR
jgi:quercetin dioxygenase-like cupin family protein